MHEQAEMIKTLLPDHADAGDEIDDCPTRNENEQTTPRHGTHSQQR